LDHAFVGCVAGAPEADALLRLGFVEGPGNTHPGQGTANRRFFFENFMLELLWVADAAEAQSERTRRTRLWERCEQREIGVCPFGIIFVAAVEPAAPAPFPIWSYAPSYLPAGMSMQIAEGTTLGEPELFYLPLLRRGARHPNEPVIHALPIRQVSGLAVGTPGLSKLSAASRIAASCALLKFFESEQHVLEILVEGPPHMRIDLRPGLPLLFRGLRSEDSSHR
jgi:Glyoxalase-like domain